MPVSQSYRDYVVEQLEQLVPLYAKAMFGGVGLYSGELFFALIANDRLYFKVDDTNRTDYEQAGMGPFVPGGKQNYPMSYYELPAELLEDTDQLRPWIDKALAVAGRKATKKGKQK